MLDIYFALKCLRPFYDPTTDEEANDCICVLITALNPCTLQTKISLKKSTLKHSSLDRVYIVLTINGIGSVYKRHPVTTFEQGVRRASAVLVIIKPILLRSSNDRQMVVERSLDGTHTICLRSF